MHTIDVITPVQMGVDLDQGDRPLIVIGAQDRDRDAVIAPDDEGQGAGGENLANGCFRIAVMCARVLGVAHHIAAIDRLDGTAIVERAIDVEVIPVEVADGTVGRLAHCCRRPRLVVGDFIDRIGRAVRNTKKGDVGVERVEIRVNLGIKHARMSMLWRGGKLVGHGTVLLFA